MSTGSHPPVRLSTDSGLSATQAAPVATPATIEGAIAGGLTMGVQALVQALRDTPAPPPKPESPPAPAQSVRRPLLALVVVIALLGSVAVWREVDQRTRNDELRAKVAEYETAAADEQARATLRRLDTLQAAVDAIFEILRRIAPDAVAAASTASPPAAPSPPPGQ